MRQDIRNNLQFLGSAIAAFYVSKIFLVHSSSEENSAFDSSVHQSKGKTEALASKPSYSAYTKGSKRLYRAHFRTVSTCAVVHEAANVLEGRI